MTITWDDIVATYMSQPWWVWLVGILLAWFGFKWLIRAVRAYAERPVITPNGFRQCGVHVDFRAGTIRLPRGNTYPVSRVRGLRWEDYATLGTYRAIVEVDDLDRPIHPVGFSTPEGPETFVSRLRTAIENAGGPRFFVTSSDRVDLIARDLSDPTMAAIATRVAARGRRVSLSRAD